MEHLPDVSGPSLDSYKRRLRADARRDRAQMALPEVSEAIVAHLEAWDVFQNSTVVLAYWPLSWEVDLLPLMFKHNDKRWFLPKVLDSLEGKMAFYQYQGESKMSLGPYKALEPDGTPLWVPDEHVTELIIVPALMIDKKGDRLGGGRGYYDRFLSWQKARDRSAITISPIPEKHFVDDVPNFGWDVPVDYIVTESGIKKVSA